MINRFLRLWPTLLLFCLINQIVMRDKVWKNIVPLFFIGNLTGPYSHIWSVAVEIQFYIFSPWIVTLIHKGNRPWIVPLLIFVVSMIFNIAMLLSFCPQTLTDNSVWTQDLCVSKYKYWNYTQMISRMSPYGFGMYTAFRHF